MKQKFVEKLYNFISKHHIKIGAVCALAFFLILAFIIWNIGQKHTKDTVSSITNNYGKTSEKQEENPLYEVYQSKEEPNKTLLTGIKDNANQLLDKMNKQKEVKKTTPGKSAQTSTLSSKTTNTAIETTTKSIIEKSVIPSDLYAMGIVKVHLLYEYKDGTPNEIKRDISAIQFNKNADYLNAVNSKVKDWNISLDDEDNDFDLGMHILKDIGFDINLNNGTYLSAMDLGIAETGITTQHNYTFSSIPKALTTYLDTLNLKEEQITALNSGFAVRQMEGDTAAFDNMYYTIEYTKENVAYMDMTAYYMVINTPDKQLKAFLLKEE